MLCVTYRKSNISLFSRIRNIPQNYNHNLDKAIHPNLNIPPNMMSIHGYHLFAQKNRPLNSYPFLIAYPWNWEIRFFMRLLWLVLLQEFRYQDQWEYFASIQCDLDLSGWYQAYNQNDWMQMGWSGRAGYIFLFLWWLWGYGDRVDP